MTTFFNFAKDAYHKFQKYQAQHIVFSRWFQEVLCRLSFTPCYIRPYWVYTGTGTRYVPGTPPGNKDQGTTPTYRYLYQVVWSANRFLHPGTRYWVLLQDHSQSSIIRYPGTRGPTRFDRSMYVMPIWFNKLNVYNTLLSKILLMGFNYSFIDFEHFIPLLPCNYLRSVTNRQQGNRHQKECIRHHPSSIGE